MPRLPVALWASFGLASAVACQNYTFAYQPTADHQATHLQFTVNQPSKADLLFVIDNSGSMLNKQQALADSIGQLLDSLAPQDTRYRIGITSTDAHGFLQDCNNQDNPQVISNVISNQAMGAKGAYCGAQATRAALRRPHDATLGRLIAAYDSASFDPNGYGLEQDSNAYRALASLMPTGATTSANPNLLIGESGARWVIDREIIAAEACNACGCTLCQSGDTCYDTCAAPVSRARVQAYFRANVRGLGNQGFAWEAGLKNAMWAVGIDPEEGDDTSALDPAYNLTAGNGPNTFVNLSDTGALQTSSWVRDDALMAMLFLTDEQDCSMPEELVNLRASYETSPPPHGSICYQAAAQASFHDPNRLVGLLTERKASTSARVAVGLIAGVQQTGGDGTLDAAGRAVDCRLTDGSVAATDCACSTILSEEEGLGVENDLEWCSYTQNHQTSGLAACDAMAASRYFAFATGFDRRTFESICRSDADAFGPALANFARIATQACFELEGVQPAERNPALVTVHRTPKGSNAAPQELSVQPANSEQMGFYYDATNNKVCLTGLDRIIGDVYDIFIQQTDAVDYAR